MSEKRRRYGYARFDWDFCDDLTQLDRANRLSESVSAALLRPWNDAAHIHGRPDAAVPIWFAPSQMCNMIGVLARERSSNGRAFGLVGGESPHGGRAEALSNRWRFFATYLAPQFSPVLRHPFLVTRGTEC
jgi:hypothetical protein